VCTPSQPEGRGTRGRSTDLGNQRKLPLARLESDASSGFRRQSPSGMPRGFRFQAEVQSPEQFFRLTSLRQGYDGPPKRLCARAEAGGHAVLTGMPPGSVTCN
jgi:hypothetical protein